jgi:hypothetical protein
MTAPLVLAAVLIGSTGIALVIVNHFHKRDQAGLHWPV